MGWATGVASVCTLTVAGMKGMGMNSRITLALEPRLGLCTPSVRPPYPHSHEVTALFPCNYQVPERRTWAVMLFFPPSINNS